MPMLIMLNDHKSHFAPHFNYLDQTNVAALLMMPLAPHDADNDASGVDMTKMTCYIPF